MNIYIRYPFDALFCCQKLSTAIAAVAIAEF